MKQWDTKDISKMLRSIGQRLQLIEWRQQQLQLQSEQRRQQEIRRKSGELDGKFEETLKRGDAITTGKQPTPTTDKRPAQPTQTTGEHQRVQHTDPLRQRVDVEQTRTTHAVRPQSEYRPDWNAQQTTPAQPLHQSLDQMVTRVDSARSRAITPTRLVAVNYQLADDISLQATTLVPIVRLAPPTAQTAPMTPLPPVASARPKPPQIIEVGPDRIEHHLLPGTIEPLRERMLALVLYFSCRYDTAPDFLDLPPFVYDNILPFCAEGRYEFGFPVFDYPVDDPRQKLVHYRRDPSLNDATIACVASDKATNKLPTIR